MRLRPSNFRSRAFPTLLDLAPLLQSYLEVVSRHGIDAHNVSIDELVAVRCAGVDERAEWAARRACWQHGRYPKPGLAESQGAALARAHAQFLLCVTPGCGALVDLQAARRRARADGHAHIPTGCGCASAVCSARHSPQRFAGRQARRAAALLDGTGELVLPPRTTAGLTTLWAMPRPIAQALARALSPTAHAADAPSPTATAQ